MPPNTAQLDIFGSPVSQSWRPINYLGSKMRLISVLRDVFDDIDPHRGPLCDLFSGSCSVAFGFSLEREVTAVDIQTYSKVLGQALLNEDRMEPMTFEIVLDQIDSRERQALLSAVAELIAYEKQLLLKSASGNADELLQFVELAPPERSNSQATGHALEAKKLLSDAQQRLSAWSAQYGHPSTIVSHFGGLYFSVQQAVDLLLLRVAACNQTKVRSVLAPLLSVASDVVNSVGKQFAQPMKVRDKDGALKSHVIKKIIQERSRPVKPLFDSWARRYSLVDNGQRNHSVAQMDSIEFLSQAPHEFGVIYADPPYTRDHYSRFYHVLETIVLFDSPSISKSCKGTRDASIGMYRADRYQSPFCIKNQALSAFESLFLNARNSGAPIVVSYSPYSTDKRGHPRVVSIDQIVQKALAHYRQVDVTTAGKIAHRKLNKSDLHLDASDEAELLIVCTP